LDVFVPSVTSFAVIVAVPAVFKVTLSTFVPSDNAAFAGRLALLSDEFSPAVSMTEFTRFQFASTALTVTLKAVPAFCAFGVPVLPDAVPGTAVSPGNNSCNFTKLPARTVRAVLVLEALLPSVTSLAVTVWLPAVFSVALKFCVPDTSAAFTPRLAFESDEAR